MYKKPRRKQVDILTNTITELPYMYDCTKKEMTNDKTIITIRNLPFTSNS